VSRFRGAFLWLAILDIGLEGAKFLRQCHLHRFPLVQFQRAQIVGRGIRESVEGPWGSVTNVVRRVILSEIVRSFRVPLSLLQDYHLVHQQVVALVGGLDLQMAEGKLVFLR